MTQEDEEAVNGALLDALGSEGFAGCGSMLERISILISQRDNAYNEAAEFKPKNDLARIQLLKKLRDQIVVSCKARAEAIPTGDTNWTRIELIYLHEHMTKEKSILDNYERILKETENG